MRIQILFMTAMLMFLGILTGCTDSKKLFSDDGSDSTDDTNTATAAELNGVTDTMTDTATGTAIEDTATDTATGTVADTATGTATDSATDTETGTATECDCANIVIGVDPCFGMPPTCECICSQIKDTDTGTEPVFTSCAELEVTTSAFCLPSLTVDAGSSAQMDVWLVLPVGCTQVTQVSGELSTLPEGVTLTPLSLSAEPRCILVGESGNFNYLTASASGQCPEWLNAGVLLQLEFNVEDTVLPGTYPLSFTTFMIGDNFTEHACRADSSLAENDNYLGNLIVQ